MALAALGYCVWPSVTAFMSQPEGKPPAKLPTLESALLRPKMPLPPLRDPFRVEIAGQTASAGKQASAGQGAGGRRVGSAGEGAVKKRVDPLAGLSLDATCIVGAQRLAVINGRVYTAQETLATSSSAAPPLKIANILPHMVLLQCEGKTLELTYSNVGTARAASHEPDVYVGGPNETVAGAATKRPRGLTGRSSGNSRTNGTGK